MGLAMRRVPNHVPSAVRTMSSPRLGGVLDFVPAKPEAIGPVCYPTYKQGENSRPSWGPPGRMAWHGVLSSRCGVTLGAYRGEGGRCWCLLADLTDGATEPLLFVLTRGQKPTAVWCCWKQFFSLG